MLGEILHSWGPVVVHSAAPPLRPTMSSRATDAEFDTWLCAAPATLSTEQLGRTVETLCPSSLAGFLAVLEAACTARRRLNGMEFGNLDPDGRAACK